MMKTFKTYITEGKKETVFLVDTVYSKYIEKYSKNQPECVGWLDGSENALIRNQKIYEAGIDEKDSVLDVGCGVAHFHTYLTNQGWNGKYLGFDPNKKAIDVIDENINAVHGTIEDLDDTKYDWVVATGVFNLGLTEDVTFSIIHNMICRANKGVVFNMLKYPYGDARPLDGHDNITYESYHPNYVRNKLLKYDNDRIEIVKNYLEDDTEFTIYFYKENE